MAANAAERLSHYSPEKIPTFGVNNLKKIDGMQRLNVVLANTNFALPLVHINIPEANVDAAIGWFNPDPYVNPQIDEASTIIMGDMLQALDTKVVVMTNSSKSEHLIQMAMKNLPPDTQLIILPSGKEETDGAAIRNRSVGELTSYIPVTGTPKVMGYPKEAISLEELRKLCPNGKGLFIVDDVYSTGETVRTMETVLGLGTSDEHHVAVIAIEKQYDVDTAKYIEYPLPPNLHAAFCLTEFLKLDALGIQRDELFQNDKATIPKAILLPD